MKMLIDKSTKTVLLLLEQIQTDTNNVQRMKSNKKYKINFGRNAYETNSKNIH